MFQPAKGLLMLLIILCHTFNAFGGVPQFSFQANPVSAIPTFVFDFFFVNTIIPCFFMICGYSFRRRPLRFLLKGTPLFVLRAYLITSAIIICLNTLRAIILGGNAPHVFISECLSFALIIQPGGEFLGHSLSGISTVWFLCVLAVDSILLNQILALRSRRSQIAVCALLACIGILLKDITLPFCIQQICICCSFMYLGFVISQEKLLTRRMPWYLVVLPLLLWLFLFLKGDHRINISNNLYPNGLLDLIAIWSAGYLMLYAAAYLGQFDGKFFEALSWVGQYSFILCCVHHVEKTVLPLRKMVGIVIHDPTLQFLAVFLLHTGICLALTYAFVQFGKKKRLHA